jgi:hypothetical protein
MANNDDPIPGNPPGSGPDSISILTAPSVTSLGLSTEQEDASTPPTSANEQVCQIYEPMRFLSADYAEKGTIESDNDDDTDSALGSDDL